MRDNDKIERTKVEAEGTLELFCDLIGRIVIQHEWINAELRRSLGDVLHRVQVPFEPDLADRLVYAYSAAELRKNFLSVVSATFKRLTPSLKELPEFQGFIEDLGKYLTAENNARNHIIHSEYFRNADMTGMDEILGSSLVSNKRGRYSIKRFDRKWLIEFTRFQKVLYNAIGLINEDLFEDADLFEQARMNAPSEEEYQRRDDMHSAGELTPSWLVSEYLRKDFLIEVREAYKVARIGDVDLFYSDDDEGQFSVLRSGWRPGHDA